MAALKSASRTAAVFGGLSDATAATRPSAVAAAKQTARNEEEARVAAEQLAEHWRQQAPPSTVPPPSEPTGKGGKKGGSKRRAEAEAEDGEAPEQLILAALTDANSSVIDAWGATDDGALPSLPSTAEAAKTTSTRRRRIAGRS
mgnify:CR=1 FL=1